MLQMKQAPLGQGSIGAQLDAKFEITTKTRDGYFRWLLNISVQFEGEVEWRILVTEVNVLLAFHRQ